ncbi:PBPe domain-containing protein [Caerostris extrusa]|uniref:PBPe domain-containing protein n=1 Tax=Caerostris extrusa TaxID=172846 RepID=A0AAV4M783_CAEEX|nr:PBPe domain-containing protein [Caerostris extrusa]
MRGLKSVVVGAIPSPNIFEISIDANGEEKHSDLKHDFAISCLSVTESRSKYVDFTTFYAFEETTFALKKVNSKPTFAYLHPFDIWVWMSLIGAYVYVSFVYAYVQCQEIDIQLLLLSFLTVPHHIAPIKTFRELNYAVQKGTHQCYVLKGTSTVPFLLSLKEDFLQELGKAIEMHHWYYTMDDMASGKHISDHAVEIQSQMAFDIYYGEPRFKANIIISDDYLAEWPMAIAVNKQFCCKEQLDRVMSRSQSAGLYIKYLRDESLKILFNMSKDTYMTHENKQLSIDDVSGVLIMLGLGYCVSLFVFLRNWFITGCSNISKVEKKLSIIQIE